MLTVVVCIFICGSSASLMAQEPVKTEPQTEQTGETLELKEDAEKTEELKADAPAAEEPKAEPEETQTDPEAEEPVQD